MGGFQIEGYKKPHSKWLRKHFISVTSKNNGCNSQCPVHLFARWSKHDNNMINQLCSLSGQLYHTLKVVKNLREGLG